MRGCAHAALLAILMAAHGAGIADTAQEWHHTIEPGDTLIGLTERHLREGISWRRLQGYNRVTDPYRLQPGRTLRAPIAWVREQAAPAEVLRVTDPVMRIRQGVSEALSPGDQVRSGDVIEAGPGGAATLRFGDGRSSRPCLSTWC